MKKFISLILCILLLGGCAETYDGPTTAEQVLTEYEVRQYSTLFDDQVWISRSVYAYDIYGNRVRQMMYRDGELTSEHRWRYDEQGNRIAETVIDHSGWIPLIDRRTKQTFDEQNRVLSITGYDFWGREMGQSLYTYDDEAHTMTRSSGGENRVTYYYDETGRQIRDVSASGYETVYEYDERGNRIGWVSTKDGAFYGSYEAGFDEQNRLVWGTSYDENGAQNSHVTYTYDDEANTTTIGKTDGGKRIEYRDGEGRIHLIEDYDSDGNLTMVQQYFYRDIRVPASGEE